jgi:hypothetical protein
VEHNRAIELTVQPTAEFTSFLSRSLKAAKRQQKPATRLRRIPIENRDMVVTVLRFVLHLASSHPAKQFVGTPLPGT